MTENKRFTFAYETNNQYLIWWAVRDGDITLWKEEVVNLLNEQYEEIEYLKPRANENSNYIEDLEEDIIHYRQENEYIKNTIKEAYNNERTQLGKSVLKQLMEAIQ